MENVIAVLFSEENEAYRAFSEIKQSMISQSCIVAHLALLKKKDGHITLADAVPADAEKMVSVVTNDAKIFMPLAELVDLDAERARLRKELEKAQKQVEGQERKLANENFVSRAPEQVVATERERLEKAKALVENLTESLKNLG